VLSRERIQEIAKFLEPGLRKAALPPVVDDNTEILILGTLPSDQSLAVGQYYANPNNDFWNLLAAVLKQNLEGVPYEAKIEILRAHGIGLWDAFHTGFRPGSMDKDITDQELNDFDVLKEIARKLFLVCFNGQAAVEAEDSLHALGYKTCDLPSSRSANRKNQDGRLLKWRLAIQR
jgi:double-stranded uracil-DNA glycosylase